MYLYEHASRRKEQTDDDPSACYCSIIVQSVGWGCVLDQVKLLLQGRLRLWLWCGAMCLDYKTYIIHHKCSYSFGSFAFFLCYYVQYFRKYRQKCMKFNVYIYIVTQNHWLHALHRAKCNTSFLVELDRWICVFLNLKPAIHRLKFSRFSRDQVSTDVWAGSLYPSQSIHWYNQPGVFFLHVITVSSFSH